MSRRTFRPSRRRRSPAEAAAAMADAIAKVGERRRGYRERSLAIHGWICARCAREFESVNLNLLTVHHKDGNHDNNPADGSNWENLCADCHDAEHSKELLADWVAGED